MDAEADNNIVIMPAKIQNNSDVAIISAKKLQKRNKNKWFGFHLSGMLYYGNPDSSLQKSYQNTFHCNNVLEIDEEGVVRGKYCKNRWCPICQRNKMGLLINTYGPKLEECEELWFITLTRPNVKADQLKGEVKQYQVLWREISKSRTYRMFMKMGIIGIRKFECTYHATEFLKNGVPDPWYDTYHPHLHLLVSSREFAEFILNEWLRLNPDSSRDAQNIRKVDGSNGYLEIFKYFTKLIAKDNTGRRFFDAIHMDVIFRAVHRRQVYFRIGTNAAWGGKEIKEDETDEVAMIESDASSAFYTWLESDEFYGYYDVDTGETLTELPKNGRLFEIITESEKKISDLGSNIVQSR